MIFINGHHSNMSGLKYTVAVFKLCWKPPVAVLWVHTFYQKYKLSTVYAIYFRGFLFSAISRVGCYSRIYQHAKIFTSDPDA